MCMGTSNVYDKSSSSFKVYDDFMKFNTIYSNLFIVKIILESPSSKSKRLLMTTFFPMRDYRSSMLETDLSIRGSLSTMRGLVASMRETIKNYNLSRKTPYKLGSGPFVRCSQYNYVFTTSFDSKSSMTCATSKALIFSFRI